MKDTFALPLALRKIEERKERRERPSRRKTILAVLAWVWALLAAWIVLFFMGLGVWKAWELWA